jgi:hypothetical protein
LHAHCGKYLPRPIRFIDLLARHEVFRTPRAAVFANIAFSLGDLPLRKNFQKCPHCGLIALRLTERTLLVNRSDEMTFHLALFSGPYRQNAFAGELRSEQLVCNFIYVHDRIGPHNEHVTVTVRNAKEAPDDVFHQIEEVADKIADLVAQGRRVARIYAYYEQQLWPAVLK